MPDITPHADRPDEPSPDDRLLQQLRQAGDSFIPEHLGGLVEGGVVDGRRRRRRRTVAIVGGAAALALIAAGGVLTPALLRSAPDRQESQAADGQHSAAPTPNASGAAQPGVDHSRDMVSTLERLLPAGASFSSPEGRWWLSGGVAPLGSVVYDDSHGASLIEVGLNRVGDGSVPSCPDPAYTPNDVCSSRRLPDGSRLMVDQGYEYPSRGTGTKDWTATLIKPNGLEVQASEWNAPEEKGAPVSRPAPPLDAAQLRALVTAPAWQPLLDAMPAPHTPPAATVSQGPTGAAIAGMLAGLLPKGVTSRHQDIEGGYVQEQLSDGTGGVGLIGINVQQWNLATDGPGLAPVYAGATVLPDGSKLVLSQGSAEKGGSGAVEWIADVLHPNGLRVVVMEFNAPAQGEAADRARPVLTMSQLQALVTADRWTSLG